MKSFPSQFILFVLFPSVLPEPDRGGGNGGMKIVHLQTHGAELRAQIERLDRFNQVFPPKDESHFIPYGDRGIVALQFPNFQQADTFNQVKGDNYGQVNPSYGPWEENPNYGSPNPNAYGNWEPPTNYGPQDYGYGASPPEKPRILRRAKDFGVIISQNYIHRRNVRDYRGFSKIFENARSTQDILLDVGRGLGSTTKSRGISSNLLDLLDPKHLQDFRSNPSKSAPSDPSFALIAIETRVKIGAGRQRDLSLTNGTLIFPSAKDPGLLCVAPFLLGSEGDTGNIFRGAAESRAHLPSDQTTTLFPFVTMVEGIHADSHVDGRKSLERNRKLGAGLRKERLPMPEQLYQNEDKLEEEEAAKASPWLTTVTIAIRRMGGGGGGVEPRKIKEYGPPKYGPPSSYGIRKGYGKEEGVKERTTNNYGVWDSSSFSVPSISNDYGSNNDWVSKKSENRDEVYFFKGRR